MSTPPFAIVSQNVVLPDGIHSTAILIEGDSITGLVNPSAIPSKYTTEDLGKRMVMPGLVDSHVHINEPGRTEWEGFETATRAAAAGGITTLIDMPLNSSPVTTTCEALRCKTDAAAGKLSVDCGFYGGIIPGNAHEIEDLAVAGVLGYKAFLVHSGIDEFPNVTEADLHTAMPIIAGTGLALLVHCELQSSIPPPNHGDNPRSYKDYLSSRPPQWELDAIRLMISLCRKYSCRVHIVHVSSAESLPLIRQAKEEGLPLTAETCPHYLVFNAEEIPDGDTRFKCAPPIRDRENCVRLWEGLREGVLDMVVSDHSPSPPELKCIDTGDFQKAWGGIASLQFGFPAIWTEASRRGFTIADVVRWMSTHPAQLVGLENRKGSITPGYEADFVVWDPDATFTVEQSMIHHRHKLTPYEGRTLMGNVERTYLRGNRVYDGTSIESPLGKVLTTKTRRHEEGSNR